MKKFLLLAPFFMLLTGCPWDSKDSNEPISTPIELAEPTLSETPSTSETENALPANDRPASTRPDEPPFRGEADDASEAPQGDLDTGTEGSQDTTTPETPSTPNSQDWRTNMLTLVNAQRAVGTDCGGTFYQAQPPLHRNTLLDDAAQLHSEDMRDQNYFSHTSLDGRSAGTRISNAGYDWNSYAENIAAGQDTVEEVVQGWIDSPGHCANIMRSSVTEVGFGLATGGGQYGQYWTQNFGRQ